MTSLDLIQALMVGAGISQFQAAKVLGEHDREIARNALAGATRRVRASDADRIAGCAR